MSPSQRWVGIGAAIVTVAIWTGFIITGRASAGHVLLPFDLGLVRIVGAAVVLMPWGWWLTRRGRVVHGQASLGGLSPLPLRPTVVTGLVGGLVYSAICYAGFFFAPAAHASVLLPGSQPLWAALLSIPLLGESLTRNRVIGLLFIVCGALLVGGMSLLQAWDGSGVWRGDLLFLGAGFCWAAYGVLARRYRLEPIRATIAMTTFACLSYVPLFALLAATGAIPSRLLSAPVLEILLQALFQGVCVVGVAGITFITMVRTFGPVRAAMITALVPGLSALGASVVLNEPLSWNAAIGLVLVTIGIVCGVFGRQPFPRTTPEKAAMLGGTP